MNGLNKQERISLFGALIIIIVVIIFGGIVSAPPYAGLQTPAASATSTDQAVTQPQQTTMTTPTNAQNISTDPNLEIYDVAVGTGAVAKAGDTVTVNYVGTLQNGTKFDSSIDRGTPFTFKLGAGQVIKGWDIGVAGMKVGGERKLVISPAYGYGAQATGPIPANSVLLFDVTLLKVN